MGGLEDRNNRLAEAMTRLALGADTADDGGTARVKRVENFLSLASADDSGKLGVLLHLMRVFKRCGASCDHVLRIQLEFSVCLFFSHAATFTRDEDDGLK
jgi:hypothetical protein